MNPTQRHSVGGASLFPIQIGSSVDNTSEIRKGEMTPSTGGSETRAEKILGRLAANANSDIELMYDAKDFLLRNGSSGIYRLQGKESTILLKKYIDGSVFCIKQTGEESIAIANLDRAHSASSPPKEEQISERAQARIDKAVEAVDGKKEKTLEHTAVEDKGKSKFFLANLWTRIKHTGSKAAPFLEGVDLAISEKLSNAFQVVRAKFPTEDEGKFLKSKESGKTPVEVTKKSPLKTLESHYKLRNSSKKTQAGTDYQKALEKEPRIDFSSPEYKQHMLNLQKGVAGALVALGAKHDGKVTHFTAKKGFPQTKLPHIKDFERLNDKKTYEILSDGKNSVSFTGAEIKRMAKTATAWSLGERGKPFTDPGLRTGLTTDDHLLSMMRAVTWSEVPRPMADQNGNVIPRQSGQPAHFICNMSAPDLTLPEMLKLFTKEDGQIDMEKIKSAFIEHAMNEFVDQCLENGVQQMTIPAIGLGAFAIMLTPDQKKEYAQAIMKAAVERIKEKDLEGQIQVIAFSGNEFMGEADFVDGLDMPDHLNIIVTDNETTSCEIAAGQAGLRSATLNAGDQNKLPGYHAFDAIDQLISGGDSYISHIAQDEAQQLKNPMFAILQSPVFNSYFREKLNFYQNA